MSVEPPTSKESAVAEKKRTRKKDESTEDANKSTEDTKNVEAHQTAKATAEKEQTAKADPVFTQMDVPALDDDKKAQDLQPMSFPSSGERRLMKFYSGTAGETHGGSWNHGHISWPVYQDHPILGDRNVGTPAQTLPKQAAGVYES